MFDFVFGADSSVTLFNEITINKRNRVDGIEKNIVIKCQRDIKKNYVQLDYIMRQIPIIASIYMIITRQKQQQ